MSVQPRELPPVDVPSGESDHPLPELADIGRPRWRADVPVLWRSATSVQLGDDVVITRVGREEVEWMTGLDGLRTAAELTDDLPLPVIEARRLLRAMRAAGALDDAARLPNAVRWARRWDRDATISRYAGLLDTVRDLDHAHEAMDARDRMRVHLIGTGELADHLRTALHAAGLAECHGSPPTVAVLADAPHPDVPAHADHTGLDLPHLHIGIHGARAVIGPLVVPGLTSCLRCAHLHRRDADPSWPLLAVQWAHAAASAGGPTVDPLLARLAADLAALHLRSWSDYPDDPERWGDRAVEVGLPDGTAVRQARPPHPLCGCRWS